MRTTTKFSRAIVTASVLALMTAASASADVVWAGPSDGDSSSPMETTFAGFTANQIVGITGGGYLHDHGNPTTFQLQLLLNGTYTTVASFTSTGDYVDRLLMNAFGPAPISFASSTVTGIRLLDTPEVGNGYHGMYGSNLASGDTTFQFASAVPEPGTVSMLGAGLGLLVYRRFRK